MPALEDRQKIPVPRHSFLWSLNETSGEVLTHTGPTEFTPSANDRIVRANGRGGFETAPMESRPFVLARDGEYVLLENPVLDDASDAQNGSFVPGGNKEKPLRMGTSKTIPGPCSFPLWPGQSAEVRHAHKLGANHYLVVEVVGRVDEAAPYYQLVLDSAGLASAIIDTSEGGSEGLVRRDRAPLKVGQRIVIQGRHTQLFIPPTGIVVVPAIEEGEGTGDDDGVGHLSESATEELTGLLAKLEAGLTARQFSVLKNELRHRADLESGTKAIMLSALDDSWNRKRDGRGGRSGDRRAARPTDPYARRAVVLGPKNFCILFDADGNPRIVRGPARVFPGPQDTFLHRGSRRRVYDAYELGEHQALWLRIISPISRAALADRLPPGFPLDKDRYDAGDELIVRGLPSVFFPFIEAEVLNPVTREPHVGNDHESVVIDAIGIDQKSGIYVRDLKSGKVKMVRGETSYVVDPRHEVHVHRRVPADAWNLWIAHGETHKRVSSDVTTPWAISVTVPNNEAIHITSRHGQRVVIGPCTELLEYEERLTALTLSEGNSKDGTSVARTCFLRIRGGRTHDSFDLESGDFVRFRVRLEVAYEFEGDPDRWFSVEDPIKAIADALRAGLRAAVRTQAATTMLTGFAQVLRNTIFGESDAFTFADNGLRITAVDVLSLQVVDPELARLFDEAQRELVKLQLQDQQSQRRLESTRLRDQIDAQEHELQRLANERMTTTQRLELEDGHGLQQRRTELEASHAEFTTAQEVARAKLLAEAEVAREALMGEGRAALRLREAEAHASAEQLRNSEAARFAQLQADIERTTARVLAEADAVRLQAIQQELVGALHSAADSEVMKAAANNMNLVALLGGKSPAQLFAQLLEGTPLARTAHSMQRRTQSNGPNGANGTNGANEDSP